MTRQTLSCPNFDKFVRDRFVNLWKVIGNLRVLEKFMCKQSKNKE